ncbi:MAG: transcriptional regulator [Gammaproteobacteria bacterium RIFCSPHIGHO2_12_FULL_41_15]|nr:MAG: transcriptional regulator [Gammaproteobacteria bacterium RIFCSPHIGHO2_12_FULL_41_15]
MSDATNSMLKGALEALDYVKGNKKGAKTHKVKIPDIIDVKLIRKNLKLTRKEFSEEFGFSIRTLEKWERGERVPEGPARAYLAVISKDPKAVRKALS